MVGVVASDVRLVDVYIARHVQLVSTQFLFHLVDPGLHLVDLSLRDLCSLAASFE